ncbi:MAG: AraC family transcriptional regulator ligand-binding domain-containing protein [Pseudomonadota bacterium]
MVNLIELAHIVDVIDSFGSPAVATRALRSANLSRDILGSRAGFIPYASVAVLAESAARSLGERHLGVYVGRKFDYNSYDGYAEYVLSAPCLGTALKRAHHALPLIHPGSDLSLDMEGTDVTIGFSGRVESVLGYRHIREGTLFVIVQAFNHFLGSDWHPQRLEIAVADARARSLLEEFMGSPLRTGAPFSALVFEASELRAPNPIPESERSTVTLREVRARMAPPIPEKTADALVHLFRAEHACADLTQERAARLLNVGPRTLQRELRSEGTSFREIRNREMHERARALLVESALTIDDVARSLGFDEPNSFRRAFHKWTGCSPGDYRRRHGVV